MATLLSTTDFVIAAETRQSCRIETKFSDNFLLGVGITA
jgi:hypothetical protein